MYEQYSLLLSNTLLEGKFVYYCLQILVSNWYKKAIFTSKIQESKFFKTHIIEAFLIFTIYTNLQGSIYNVWLHPGYPLSSVCSLQLFSTCHKLFLSEISWRWRFVFKWQWNQIRRRCLHWLSEQHSRLKQCLIVIFNHLFSCYEECYSYPKLTFGPAFTITNWLASYFICRNVIRHTLAWIA